MPYKDFYELMVEPFSNAPVARFYFAGPEHERCLRKLRYGIDNMKGLAICVGDIGAGKTTLARRLLDSLPDREFEAALLVIVHSGITASWLLKRIALQLGVPNPANEKLALLSQLYRRLIHIYEAGKKAVVLIDESQMLKSRDIMEEFRGLLNLEVPGRKLINFVFFGLEELDQSLRIDEPLRQRVAIRTWLRPLNLESTHAYVRHRLKLSGATREIFSAKALDEVYRYSHGIPRLTNTICDNVLFEGVFTKQTVIQPELVKEVAIDLDLEPLEPEPSSLVEHATDTEKTSTPKTSTAKAEDTFLLTDDDLQFEDNSPKPQAAAARTNSETPAARDAATNAQPRTTIAAMPPQEREKELKEFDELLSELERY